MNVSFIARQLGHASPATTLNVYAHLFDEAASVGRVRERVNGQFREPCHSWRPQPPPQVRLVNTTVRPQEQRTMD
jgi:integrase